MDQTLQERILERLAEPDYQPTRLRPLAKQLDITAEEMPAFRAAVEQLLEEGRIREGRSRGLMLPPKRSGEIIGVFSSNPRGFGFVRPEGTDARAGQSADIFIPPGETRDAADGDTVAVRLARPQHGTRRAVPSAAAARRSGSVVRVLTRGITRVVGTLLEAGGVPVVRPDGNRFTHDIAVPDAGAKGASRGDKVVVEILRYPSDRAGAEGVILEVLGGRTEPGVDALSILRQHEIPEDFTDEQLEAARAAADRFTAEATAGREDLRDRLIVTVDPATARDFDDAVSVDRLPDGGWELGVHIADVSFFVPEGEVLDGEARLRGNSVYLPRRVVPMLPEVLSNGVCSLQEGVDRLCKSAFIRLSATGQVLGERFAETVIHNRKRYTYEQVTEVLAGRLRTEKPDADALLLEMDALAKVLLERRRRDGMLELHLPIVELIYDAEMRVIDARPESHDFSHRIIEMFMLEANEAVARYLARMGMPTLRRVHEDPEPDALEALNKFLRSCGLRMKDPGDRNELRELLARTADTPQQSAVHLAVLRSMRKAEYSPDDAGHYALASADYLHFTSPIRRYPDLVVHRTLVAALSRKGRKRRVQHEDGEAAAPPELYELARHCSMTERRAEDAEREYRLVKVLELLKTMIGEEIVGVVTGVAGFGVFVQSTKYLVDGLVHVSTLENDFWELSDSGGALIGKRTRKRLRIGDPVTVRIAAVDVARRKLDLTLAGVPTERAEPTVVRRRAEPPPTPAAGPERPRRGRPERGRPVEEEESPGPRRRGRRPQRGPGRGPRRK